LLSDAYLDAGRPDEARRAADIGLTGARERKERGEEPWCLRALAEVALRAEPPDLPTANACYVEALTLAEGLGMRTLAVHCHFGLGKLFQRSGQREQAREHLTAATTMYREMDMRFHLTQAEAELRQLERPS
jgi:hypothetical protein